MSWTHEHSWKLSAAPAAVFEALTSASALRSWFAEHVDVGSRAGEPFAFWGRHTLETPWPDHATQRITEVTDNRMLAFSWTIAGVETHVAIALSEESEACRLLLHHTVNGTLPFARERELIDDHWRFVFGNLAAYLAGGVGISLPDFTDTAPEVRQVMLIDAPRDVVFRTLITPELVNQWFGTTTAVIEPREGGRYEVGWKYKIDGRDVVGGPTRILEFVENERLKLDWPDWRGDETVTGQTITFDLESVGAQTRLTFVHAGFLRTADISDFPFGWDWFLSTLRDVAVAQHVAATGQASA